MNKVSLGLTERLEAGTNAFFYGQLAGDNVALIQGFFEVLGGGTVAAAGTGLSVGSGGVLSVVGAPAAAGGIALAGHGAAIFGQEVKNILKAEGPGNGGSVRKPWKLTRENAFQVRNHRRFGTFYKSKSDGLWWTVDRAGHRGSKF